MATDSSTQDTAPTPGTIRLSRPDDLPAVVDIYNQSVPEGWSTADTQPVSVESRRPWFERHDPEQRPLWVLEVDGKVEGWISLEWFYQGRPAYNATAEVSLYVSTAYQGKGTGTRLMQHVVDQCPRLGIKNLLAMHFDHNPASLRLNKRFGFVQHGHLTDIATVRGESRGLLISILRIPGA